MTSNITFAHVAYYLVMMEGVVTMGWGGVVAEGEVILVEILLLKKLNEE